MRDAFRARYDRFSDVLYISVCPESPAIAEEGDEPGLMWRYAVDGGGLVGVTVLDFEGYWAAHINALIQSLSARFHVTINEAKSALEAVH